MSLERCNCCAKYKRDEHIDVAKLTFTKKKYTICDECKSKFSIPIDVANRYWNKIVNGKLADIDSSTVYFKDEYISLREYYKIIYKL
jgi:hypothetical protein